jgi:hypothetical protein
MAFDGGIAASYLGSFRPVAPVPGFENVLSTKGIDTLAAIPKDNAALETQLAAAALNEIGANERLQRNIDAIALQNDLTRRSDRRLGALRMAGGLLANAFGGGSEVGVNPGDPLSLLNALGNFSQAERTRRANNTLRSNVYSAEMLKGLS